MLIKIILFTIVFILFGFYAWSQVKPAKTRSPINENPYQGFRNQVLSLKPTAIGLHIPDNKEEAFGVVLEIGTGGGVATIISLATGDASMYTSSSSGIIGGIAHPGVKKAAIAFVKTSQTYFHKMQTAKNLDIPKAGDIKIFILTNKHKYAYEAPENDITNEKSDWAELFYKGNEVITQLRLTVGQSHH